MSKSRKHKKSLAGRQLHNARHPNPWIPIGYYKNRPALMAKIAGNGLGRIESVQFVVSKYHG